MEIKNKEDQDGKPEKNNEIDYDNLGKRRSKKRLRFKYREVRDRYHFGVLEPNP